ncbi:MAG: YbjN domain-containing protein [Sneathiellaceae bacterium]
MTDIEHEYMRFRPHPMDLVEQLVVDQEWPFDRQGEDDLTVGVGGQFSEYQLWFSWRHELDALQFCCCFDMKVPGLKRKEVHGLLAMINEKVSVGHFDIWPGEGVILFRHSLLLRGTGGATSEQIQDLVEIGLNESERFYPSFQYVVWGGKTPEDSLAAALLEPVGEA